MNNLRQLIANNLLLKRSKTVLTRKHNTQSNFWRSPMLKLLFAGITGYSAYLNLNYLISGLNYFNSLSIMECFSLQQKEISISSYPANNPIEDRYDIKFLKSLKGGAFFSVLDGHGGFTMSEFANQRLAKYFDELLPSALKNNPNEQQAVSACLKETFAKVESEFKEFAIGQYNYGEGKLACVGSCALVAVIYNDYLYVANLGDSKARLIRYDPQAKEYYAEKLMHRHQCEKPREMERLKKMFPNDKDIVVCKRPNNTVCYVKGRLQPTRAFGDFHLKHQEFNLYDSMGYKRPIKVFNGPYISAVPEITVYPLDYTKDKYIFLSSDGLCDYVRTTEIVDIMSKKLNKSETPKADDLLERVLQNAASESGLTKEQIQRIPLGKRRSYHDDTTILLFPLKK